jgi:DNA-binding CsgD family transcriptional regulator
VAGVEAMRRRAAGPQVLGRTLDVLRESLLVTDRAGRILHANGALVRTTAEDPEGGALLDAMQRVARQLTALLGRPEEVAPRLAEGPLIQELTTQKCRYRIRGSLLDEGALGAGAAVLVALESLGTRRKTTAEELRERYGLTPTQAETALLVAEGLSDKKLAERLRVRPNTARHHVEQVRSKLGVSSRAAVTAKILSG